MLFETKKIPIENHADRIRLNIAKTNDQFYMVFFFIYKFAGIENFEYFEKIRNFLSQT